jgi:hypothetical protein
MPSHRLRFAGLERGGAGRRLGADGREKLERGAGENRAAGRDGGVYRGAERREGVGV